ncbi:protein translocase subunit SecD [Aquabacterium sp.]|uniref:protein translocase subunit SecD n=1 Tax=Aquabacterium sp. TaxID=1872578 RepID=UPI0035B35FA1
MNRYPLWKYAIIATALIIGFIYTLPNFFGEAPAVQVSSGRATVKVNSELVPQIESALQQANIKADFVQFEGNSIKARFADTDTQIKARDTIARALNTDPADPSYIVALNLLSRSPSWLTSLHALPMYLGLDLRGGVHFLMQVDMQGALTKKAESIAGDARSLLRDKNVRHAGINRVNQTVEVNFRDRDNLNAARKLLTDQFADVNIADSTEGAPAGAAPGDLKLVITLKPQVATKVQEQALKQNITTLHNRINELGVAEPVIQQQGLDRIVVQLPGVQDTAKAKDILGRTATLEVRLVDDSNEALAALTGTGPVPFGTERYAERGGAPLIVKRQVILTGDNLTDAQPGFDETQQPAVHLTLNDRGARIFRDVTRENVGKRMAILLFEKGKGEVVTAPVIRGEISGGRVQISGRMTSEEANDTALLLRAGSLATPMEIIEERTVGPSLGAENIKQGFNSLVYGFAAIAVFMCAYYLIFGAFSTIALGVNLLLLIAILSMLQATLTLPGIAAIALALGMAIDSNVLINERVREELRNGSAPQSAIAAGYERAWATILDSNVTTLIAGIALLAFGSGPVRGFAVVHCLGILTSMFSAVFFSRGLVNLWYGGRKRLKAVSIGQVWKPAAASTSATPDTKPGNGAAPADAQKSARLSNRTVH